MQPLVGQSIAHYRIESVAGRGGMATVYLAHDLKHDRRVAIKVMDPEVGESIGDDRFLREIEFVAQLSHPHILPLYDSGRMGELLYYVMPYVEEGSLRSSLERERVLAPDDAVRIAQDVAEAIQYAHEKGIIHRDLKPGNILLSNGSALVADFGIAKGLSSARRVTLTPTGAMVGTPIYMSPEQAMGDPVDGRSDQYSLGCVVFEMIAGRPPFLAASLPELIARHASEAPLDLRLVRPGTSDHIADAVGTALSKRPENRFATTAEFASALLGQTRPRTRRSRLVRIASIIASVVVLALATWGGIRLWQGQRSKLPEGVVRIIAIDPPPEAEISRSALQGGVPIRVIVESNVNWDKLRPDEALQLQVIATRGLFTNDPQASSGDNKVTTVATRSAPLMDAQLALEGTLRPDQVSGDKRIHLQVVLLTVSAKKNPESSIEWRSFMSFEYKVVP